MTEFGLNPVQSRWRGVHCLLLVCVFLFFATGMTVKGGTNIFLFLATLLSLPLLKEGVYNRWSWSLLLVFTLPLVFTAVQLVLSMPSVEHKAMDAPSRFFLAGICLFVLARLNGRELALACWGALFGALGTMLWGYVSTHLPQYYWGDGSRAWNQFSNPIPFGALSMMLGFITLVLPLPPQCTKWRSLLWVAKLFGLLGGLVAGYYSGSRAAFLIVPPLLLIALLSMSRWRLGWVLGVLVAILLLVGGLVMSTPNRLHERINEGIHDLSVYQQNQDTSLGLRLVMWQQALDIIREHPFIGVGKQGYFNEVNARIKQGKAPGLIHKAPHPHNEILNMGVEMGVPGMVVGLLMFLLPAALFFPRLRAADEWTRFAATGGSMVVTGQFTVGLMDTYFWIVSQTAFYGMLVAVFAAIILARRRELAAA
ncbi:O-antigen ligase family protein [Chromobacterium haemolyticum]|uniref:O-antigen ligase family protein n=1 Tax=Chromobacterium haemolyticum TaxID=394935 RepID=UPI0013B359CA|nr:O-antigen ligase family protein [Chromobacterium haemolyticum]